MHAANLQNHNSYSADKTIVVDDQLPEGESQNHQDELWFELFLCEYQAVFQVMQICLSVFAIRGCPRSFWFEIINERYRSVMSWKSTGNSKLQLINVGSVSVAMETIFPLPPGNYE